MAAKALLLATHNRGKVRELMLKLGAVPLEIKSLDAFPAISLPQETGKTFYENAALKAHAMAKAAGCAALADDSGLVVDALQGAPGIYSARYAGPVATDEDNWRKLLAELQGVPAVKRTARFVCHLVLALPDGAEYGTIGECHGLIAEAPVGDDGFGYDPIFFLSDWRCTVAQLSPERKGMLSHRGRAVDKMIPILRRYAEGILPASCNG